MTRDGAALVDAIDRVVKRRRSASRAAARDAAMRRALGHVVAGIDLDKALASIRKVPPFKGNLSRHIHFAVAHTTRSGVSGRAWTRQQRMRIAAGTDATPERVLQVLVHEMVHLALPPGIAHGERFRRTFQRACRNLWKIEVPLDAEPSRGIIAYGMGRMAEKLLREKIEKGEIDLFPPDPEKPKPTREERMRMVVEARAEHAYVMHKRWAKKLAIAEGAEAKWRKKVRYYEQKAKKKRC